MSYTRRWLQSYNKAVFFLFQVTLLVTGPGKTGLIYTKYSCLYYDAYLLFYMCYPKSVNFIEFLMDFCIYDDILDMIQITDKKLLHFKLSKSGQILRVDKTCFPRPGHKLSLCSSCVAPCTSTHILNMQHLWYHLISHACFVENIQGWWMLKRSHLWPDFGKPAKLSYLVFWEILILNIQATVVPLCYRL